MTLVSFATGCLHAKHRVLRPWRPKTTARWHSANDPGPTVPTTPCKSPPPADFQTFNARAGMARRDCRCTACPNSRSSISKHGARGHWLGWPVQNLSSADTLLLGISGDRGVGCTSIPYPPAPPPPRQGRLRLGVKCTSLHMYQAKCAAYCDTWAEHRPQTANQGCRSPNPRFPILHFCPISQTCPGFSRLNGFFFPFHRTAAAPTCLPTPVLRHSAAPVASNWPFLSCRKQHALSC